MDYKLYGNADILLNDNSSTSKETWNLPSDCSMDQNDEYFGWNALKIDEDKYDEEGKLARKRKLPNDGEEDERKHKQLYKNNKDTMNVNDKNGRKATVMKGSSRMPQWQVDEDYGDLNSDIDSSLSLGTDLANNAYNVNESMLSINGMTVFKQEAPSPTLNEMTQLQVARQNHRQSPTSTQHGGAVVVNAVNSTMEDNTSQNIFNNTINQLLSQTALVSLHSVIDGNNISSPNSQDNYGVSSTNYNLIEDCRFQYVLAAATSIATKQNEDTLTYLNQGQSYEIKLKKLGDLSMYRGKMLKSIIRICFHERRLQYMEKEQMTSWQKARPGDRILEADVPLSYGAFDIVQPDSALNVIHFMWDPTKEVGVYIKVNCISTEFTPKKHGGEKGVPFRIQVETYQNADGVDGLKRLHAAACQIKVFKLKGADRKHKQDREKIMKRPLLEQEKFQPSYECTVLNDIPDDAVLSSPPVVPITPFAAAKSNPQINQNQLIARIDNNVVQQQQVVQQTQMVLPSKMSPVKPITPEKREDQTVTGTVSVFHNISHLLPESTPEETNHWLIANRFDRFLQTFLKFSGSDMLRMSREDLMQICGHADGIRLHNALHQKTIAPRLKIYVCRENSMVFNALFLNSYNNMELLQKLSTLASIPQDQVRDIYIEGPQAIHIHLTNDVLQHVDEETMFTLEVMQENGGYVFLLKPKIK